MTILYPAAALVEDLAMVDPVVARQLLDANENERLLALVTPEEVGLALCRYATRAVGIEGDLAWEADPDGWSAELAQESEFLADKEFVRRFLIAVAEAAPDEALGWVGAGPLREFISEHPDQRPWAEAQAASSQRFGRALAHS